VVNLETETKFALNYYSRIKCYVRAKHNVVDWIYILYIATLCLCIVTQYRVIFHGVCIVW